jgi:hypothetical protein
MRPSIIVALTYYTAGAPSYYVEPKYYTEAPVYYTTTCATPLLHWNYKVLHRESLILHHHICCLSSLYRGIQVLLCSQLPPNRGSCLLHHQGTTVLYCYLRCSDLLQYYKEAPKYISAPSYYSSKAPDTTPQPTLIQHITRKFYLVVFRFVGHIVGLFLVWSLGFDC